MPDSYQAILQISKEDRYIKTANKQLQLIPGKKKKLLIPLKKVETVLNKLKGQEEQISGQIKERETLVNIENEKIKKADIKMMAVKNQKEYVASQKEIETAKKTIKKVEDQILILEEEREVFSKELEGVLAEFQAVKETATEIEKTVLEEEKIILDKIEAYQKMKEEFLPNIDPELFSIYETLTNKKIIPAAVPISSASCMGCAMAIPAQLYNEIIRDLSGTCPHCGRLLIYREPEKPKEEPKKKTKKKTKAKKKATKV